jgi:hypothetical protein
MNWLMRLPEHERPSQSVQSTEDSRCTQTFFVSQGRLAPAPHARRYVP